MLDFLSFLWTAPPNVDVAIAWFIPLIASGISTIGGLASKALAKNPQVDMSKFQLGAGLPGGSVDAPYFKFTDALAQMRAAPSAAQPYLDASQDFRTGQVGLANLLTQTATGQGPSLAEALAEQQRQKNIAATLAAVSSTPGSPNVALSQRLAAQGIAQSGQTAAQQAMTGRLQEVFGAREQLGNVLGTGRQGDVAAAQAATQGEAARQAAISEIVRLALERERLGQAAAAQGEQARMQAAGKEVDFTRQLIGGVASGLAQGAGTMFGGSSKTK